MAQAGFTPISLYYSSTAGNAPSSSNLINGEVALNINDGKLYYRDQNSAIQVMASRNATAGIFTNAQLTGIVEPTTITAAAPSATTQYDSLTQSVQLYTTVAANNWVLNVRGTSTATFASQLAIGQSKAITLLVTQGATAYYQTSMTIDGIAVTPYWQGGNAPTSGNTTGIDAYTFVIIKTGATAYTVLASLVQF